MIARRALRAALLIGALATSQLSCTINDYCVGCDPGDAGGSGAQDADPDGDAATGDATDAGCIPSGAELCDGLDNDCNGSVDDGALPEVGDLCANQSGVCAGGTKVCQSGAIACDKAASPEVCDNLDNNCNGLVDEGDPGGGATCGTEQGECVAGTLRCQATTGCDPSPSCTSGCCYTCDGFVDTRSSPEACNGRDDDCDGNFDENVGSLGPCTWAGATDEGQCAIGTLACQAGFAVCTGAVYPAFELCNQLDDDCDAAVDEIYDTSIDPLNCGACGNACPAPSKTCIGSPNAGASCMTAGDCTGGSCVTNAQVRCTTGTCSYQCGVGFYDDDGMAANGCEYRCLATGAEECDGADNDCDGAVDEGLTPPALCRGGGECGATAPAAQCGGAQGWTCTYPGTVQFPETLCDGKDNDCDLNVDENQPNLGAACDDGGVGACRGTGHYVCDAADSNGPATCLITTPGATPSAELCDDQDNDCDGIADNTTGPNRVIDDMRHVQIGALDFYIDTYEASRPDASAAAAGVSSSRACSRPDVVPWRGVSFAAAQAACQAAGKQLCTAPQWQAACEGPSNTTYPYGNTFDATACNTEPYDGVPGGADDDVVIATAMLSGCVGATGVRDLSGNLKEWTDEITGQTPTGTDIAVLRGGAYDTPQAGATCDFRFSRAAVNVIEPTIGFRCCRLTAP